MSRRVATGPSEIRSILKVIFEWFCVARVNLGNPRAMTKRMIYGHMCSERRLVLRRLLNLRRAGVSIFERGGGEDLRSLETVTIDAQFSDLGFERLPGDAQLRCSSVPARNATSRIAQCIFN